MAKSYLDKDGLLYVWQKIKTLFATKSELQTVEGKIPTKQSDLNNDDYTVKDSEYTTYKGKIDTLEEKVDNIVSEGGQPNVIETVKVNGTALTPDAQKAVNVTVAQGSANGTLSVNGTDVAVKGLDSAAYTKSTDYDPAGAADAVLGKSTDSSSTPTVYGAIKKAEEAASSANVTQTVKSGTEIATVGTTKIYAPTVNNATLTIQKNGTDVATFTANSSTAATANISVPTAVSELTNDSKYQTDANVKTTVESYGYQTDANVKSTIESYGYQTASDVSNAITTAVSTLYDYKGTVANYAALPKSGQKTGDTYNVTAADATHGIKAGDNVTWNGSDWDVLSGAVDLSGYVQTSDLASITNAEIDTITAS